MRNQRKRDEILKKYPKMFKRVKYFEIEDGWLDLLDQLCKLLEPMLEEDQYATQVKEKYGGLRVYMTVLSDKAWGIIEQFEEQSKKVCEVCGQPGFVRRNRGYMQALCDKCNRVR